jgi:hypothetical protein
VIIHTRDIGINAICKVVTIGSFKRYVDDIPYGTTCKMDNMIEM